MLADIPVDPTSDAFSLVLSLAAVFTVVQLAKRGWGFWTSPLTHADRGLVSQAAFFLLTPPTVLLHEFGHMVATWALGGRVVELHYVGFSGHVVPAGFFDADGLWLLAVSGTVFSLLAAAGMMAVGRAGRGLPLKVRYLLVLGGAIQAAFALVGYPLWSLLGRFGDWVTIYDFGSTLGLSMATMGAHAALGLGLVWWWRRSLKPLLTEWDRGGMAAIEADVSDVADAGAAAALAMSLLDNAEYARAEGVAEAWLGRASGHPQARLLFVLGAAQMSRLRYDKASALFDRALAATPADDPLRQRLLANMVLAYTQDHRAKDALAAYEQLGPEWRRHAGIQHALDVIRVRTRKRPPAV